MTETATKTTAAGKQGPFGVRIDHPRNCDVRIQSVPGLKLRSDIKSNRTTKDTKTGEERVPKDQARHLGELGDVPGQEIHVNPSQGTYVVVDGLEGDENRIHSIERYMQERTGSRPNLKEMPKQEGHLDPDRMKTLCRELYWLVKEGEARLVKGTLDSKKTSRVIGSYEMHSLESIDKLPGEYLLNPGSTIPNTQPETESEFDGYIRRLNKTG